MISQQLQALAEDKILSTYLKAQEVFGRTFELPKIEYKDMGRTAGRAFYRENKIKLAIHLFEQNVEEFLNRTIPHEIAHLLCYVLYPAEAHKRPHGHLWQSICTKIGMVDVTRCHKYNTKDVPNRRVRSKPFVAHCRCGDHPVSKTIRDRMAKGYTYRCRKCETRISFQVDFG